MAELRFTHATIKAGKSIDALREARGCEENGTSVVVWLLTTNEQTENSNKVYA